MSVELLVGRDEGACLIDTVDGMAFGPLFADKAEAEAFLRWWERHYRMVPLSSATVDKLEADKWRLVLENHRPEGCPFDVDVDSYGVGFTGDSDKSYGDYTMATPDRCLCECHTRGARE